MFEFDVYKGSCKSDARIGKRIVAVLKKLADNVGKSVCAAMEGFQECKAAYRLLVNARFPNEELLEIQRAQTIERIVASECKTVIIAEDTTTASFNTLKSVDDLGQINDMESSRGFFIHSALAVTLDGLPLGLAAQKRFTRDRKEFGNKDKNSNKKAIEDKESFKWLECMESANIKVDGVEIIHVCDREGDIYELFAHAEKIGATFLCRRIHDRNITDSDIKLDKFVDGKNIAREASVEIPADSHTGRKARAAKLSLKFAKVEIIKPKGIISKDELPETIRLMAVSAKEENPPSGAAGLNWQLITNMTFTSFDDCVKCLDCYTKRWTIERFHYVLKEGCGLEKSQEKSAVSLMNLSQLLSITAVEILYLTYLARVVPDESCAAIFTDTEWKVLYCTANKTKIQPEEAPTVIESVLLLAKLGGFLGRKSDGFPGVKVLWRGIDAFRLILEYAPFAVVGKA